MAGIAIVTMSFFKDTDSDNPDFAVDRVRFAEACGTVKAAVQIGVPIIVVDASPISTVASTLTSLGAIVVEADDGARGPCMVQVYMEALRRRYLPQWTEIEKRALITDPNFPLLCSTILNGDLALARPYRTAEGMASYPDYQALSEYHGNRELEEATGITGQDWYVGPLFGNQQVAEIVIERHSKPNVKWEGLTNSVIVAHNRGLSIGSVRVPKYRYSDDQRRVETNNDTMIERRKDQRRHILSSALDLCKELGRDTYPVSWQA